MTSSGSVSPSVMPFRLMYTVGVPGMRPLTWPSVRSAYPSSARMRHAHATCSRSDCAIATTSGALAAFGGRIVRMWKAEDHDHFVGPRVGDGVPRVGRDVQRVAGRKLHGPVVESELSPAADDVCHLFGLVLHGRELCPRREDGVADRGAVAFGLLVGHEHSAPAPVWELDRVDLIEGDDGDVAHRPASGL